MAKRHDLPSTYYRVSVKALIFDDENRLLVFQDESGGWELPGGGLEHNESAEECLRREINEEVGGTVVSINRAPRLLYVDHEPPGYYKLSIAYVVTLDGGEIKPVGDDLVAAKYVGRAEFLQLPFQQSEKAILGQVAKIWEI